VATLDRNQWPHCLGIVTETDKKIKEHEKEGRWSHAAEMADKEAEKTKREDLKTRALEDYKKAGYNFDKYDTKP
jgi:hypothetical protein